MAAKVISGEAVGQCQPLPWEDAAGNVSRAAHPPQGVPREVQESPTPDAVAQLLARLAATEAETSRLVKEARETGRREGEAEGRRAAEAEVQPVLERMTASIQQVSELPAKLRARAEVDLVRLAIAIARRILQRELNVDPEVITGLVHVGLDKVRMQNVLRVRLCPDHLAAVTECFARLGAAYVEVSADPTLEPGSMIFETSRGKLDVSIGTQLAEIERGLTDRLRGQD